MVLLFFVRGWSTTRMAARYHVPKHRIWKVLHDWAVRAFALGYIQVIDEEKFATCSRMDVEWSIVRGSARTHAEVSPGYMPGSSRKRSMCLMRWFSVRSNRPRLYRRNMVAVASGARRSAAAVHRIRYPSMPIPRWCWCRSALSIAAELS